MHGRPIHEAPRERRGHRRNDPTGRAAHHHEAFAPWGRHWEKAWFGGPLGARRARRGDVRSGLLSLLADAPMHGYDLIRELEQRSGGRWRPSPGSIYPTLQLLEDEGLVTGQEQDGKRVYSITDAGRAELEERRERGEGSPWEFGPLGEGLAQFRDAAFQLGAAAMQVARTGTGAQRAKAAEILDEARKKIYALLAEG
jgi:DNA-binding PadR family transcriptional regulator